MKILQIAEIIAGGVVLWVFFGGLWSGQAGHLFGSPSLTGAWNFWYTNFFVFMWVFQLIKNNRLSTQIKTGEIPTIPDTKRYFLSFLVGIGLISITLAAGVFK